MSVLSGFIKTIKYRLTDAGYKWQSEKTSSQTVVMGDGTDNTDTVESRFGNIKGITTSTTESETGKVLDASTYATNVGAIQGITSSLATDNKNYALSASAGKDLQDQITDVNSNLIEDLTNTATNISSGIIYFRITRIKRLISIELIISAGTTNGNLLTVPADIEPKISGIRQKLIGGIADKDKNINMYFENRVLKLQTSSAIQTNVSGVYIYTI